VTTIPTTSAPQEVAERYRIALDCVHCGLCLSHCPTYQVTGLEPASPRGRIYLMRAFEEGAQPDTPALREHLDSCLVCRACETVCPSGVRFGSMMEDFRAVLHGERAATDAAVVRPPRQGARARLGAWLLHRVVPDRRRLHRLVNMAWFAQRSGLTAWARRLGVLHALGLQEAEALAPPVPAPAARRAWPQVLPAYGTRRARVLFLRGCITPELLPGMQTASLEVLRHNGCEVVTPPEQTCCGALHFHAGHRRVGMQLLRQNLQAFSAEDVDAIVVNAAGCGSTLKEYGGLVDPASPEAQAAQRVAARVRDIHEWLDELGMLPPPRAVPLRVAWDAPCHLLHGQRISEAPLRLLRAVPEIDLVPLQDADRCCGSAGSYSLVHPDLARTLGAEKAEHIRQADVDVVVTGNSGCILQIRSALGACAWNHERVRPVEVLHTMQLLLRAYAPVRSGRRGSA